MPAAYPIIDHEYDVIVVGAGGDLEDTVALPSGTFDLVAEYLGGTRPGQGGDGDGIAFFLTEEFV